MARAIPLKLQRCTNHAEREAAVRCPACHHHFCRECITEHHGKMLCVNCLRAKNDKKAARRQVFGRIMEIACMCVVLLVVFWCFSYMGRRLVQSGGKPLSKVSTEAAREPALNP
jgi:hypothetical protein